MKFYSQNRKKMAQKSRPRLKNPLDFKLTAKDVENPTDISQTVPDQTPELRTLLQKRANGQLVPHFDAQYTDADIPDVELMDQVEILDYRLDLAEKMEQLREHQHKVAKELEKRQKDDKITQGIAEELAKREKLTTDQAQTPGL